MLDKKLALLQVVAVVCVYLIAAWPLSSALQINLFVGNERATAELKGFSDMVDKQFTYVYDESNNIIKVKATLQAKSGYNIQKVYFYKCKDKQPFDCMNSMQPVISTTPSGGNMWFDAEYAWNDVKVGTKANFMYIVKLSSGGKTIWASSWDKVLESGQSFITENYNADVNLYLNSGVSTSEAKSYIESNSELPADWTDHIVFVKIGSTTTTALNSMAGSSSSIDPSGTTNPDFDTAIVTGNSLDTFDYDYTFVSAVAGEKVSNPLTLFVTGQEPGGGGGNQPVCGNGICETGENSVNCPQDCATQQSQPRLSIRNWAPQVSVCGSEDVITYDVYVENPGDIGYYSSYYYVINNQTSSPNGISCAIQHPNIYQYKCSIYVSKIPYCTPGITTIYQSFVYSSRTLTSSFPITFQSPPGRLDVMSVNPSPFDCGIDNEMTVRLAVTNPPGTNPTTQYSFDGGEYQSMTCRATSTNVYECKLTNKTICGQYQEQLSTTFKFKYGTSEIASDPVNLQVSFPPPAMGIDMVSPDTATSGQTTSMEVLLHVSSYSNFDYNTGGFKYKYLDKAYKTTSCTLEKDFGTVKYYKCTVDVEVPANIYGQRTLTFSLTGYISSQPKTITANKNFEIVSPPPEPYLRISASSLDCLKDAQLTIQAIVDNQPETTPTTQYDIGEGFKSLSCTKVQSNTYTCSIEKSIICNLYKETANVKVKFIYSSDEITAEQNVRVFLPTPNLQVYSVYPDSFEKGKVTDASVNLYIDYPGSVGQNPEFTYNYLDKLNQRMTCTLVQGKHGPTGTRDYYDCAASFDIPSSANLGNMIALFQIKASSLVTTYTLNIVQKSGANVWLEIYNEPPVAEIESGNSTNATLDVYIHNAEGLEHTVEILRNEWVTGGTCTESPSGSYQYKCSIIITASSSRTTGTYDIDFGLRVRKTGESPFTLTNKTSVSVVPKSPRMSITLTPETLYCTGGTQTNPAYVTARGDVSNLNLDGFLIHESKALLDQVPISVSCRLESNSIICDMASNSFLEDVCDEMERSNIKQPKSRPLVVEIKVRKGDQLYVLSSSKYIKVEPAPDKPYIEFDVSFPDEWQDITNKIYGDIRCLQSETIKFKFLLKNADLVHEEGKWDQSKFTFSFAAYGNAGGVLAAKREYSEGADISCKMPPQTWIDNMHRTEAYECYLSIRPSMFQRCEEGHGTITMIVAGSKSRAEGEFGVNIYKGNRKDLYDLYIDVTSNVESGIVCQVQSEKGDCALGISRLNATIQIQNSKSYGVPDDLTVTKSFVNADGGEIENIIVGYASCKKVEDQSQVYQCFFDIRPRLNVNPNNESYEELINPNVQDLRSFYLGEFNLSLNVRYLNNLITDSVSNSIGSTTIFPEKVQGLIDKQKARERMKALMTTIKEVIKWLLRIAGFCAVCIPGYWLTDKIAGEEEIKTSAYDSSNYMPGGKTIKFDSYTAMLADSGPTPLTDCHATCPDICKCGANCAKSGEVIHEGETCGGVTGYTYLDDCNAQCPDYPCTCSMNCVKSGQTIFKGANCGGLKSTGSSSGSLSVSGSSPAAIKTPSVLPESSKDPNFWSKVGSWAGIIGIILLFGTLIVGGIALITGGDFDEQKGEFEDAFLEGAGTGTVCIIMKLTEVLTRTIEDKKGLDGHDVGEGIGAVGEVAFNTCLFLVKNFDLIFDLLNIVFRMIYMQACLQQMEDDINRRYEYGSMSVGEGQEGQQTASESMQALQQLESCFGQLKSASESAKNVVTRLKTEATYQYGDITFDITGTGISKNELFDNKPITIKYKNLKKKSVTTLYVEGLCKKVTEEQKSVVITLSQDDKGDGSMNMFVNQLLCPSGFYPVDGKTYTLRLRNDKGDDVKTLPIYTYKSEGTAAQCSSYNSDCNQCIAQGCTFCKGPTRTACARDPNDGSCNPEDTVIAPGVTCPEVAGIVELHHQCVLNSNKASEKCKTTGQYYLTCEKTLDNQNRYICAAVNKLPNGAACVKLADGKKECRSGEECNNDDKCPPAA